jgi:hypothetical protein
MGDVDEPSGKHLVLRCLAAVGTSLRQLLFPLGPAQPVCRILLSTFHIEFSLLVTILG